MKNLRKGLVFALVLLSVVSLGSVAGTYAKYTSNATGTDSARVAKWSFTVEGAETTATNEFTFELFKTTYDNVASKENQDGSFDNVIAPGTAGEFTINLANNSEVTAEYTIEYTVSNDAGIPVKFSTDGGLTWDADLTDVAVSEDTTMAANGSTDTITVQWKWDFNGDDTVDTDFGKLGTDTITVKAKITATQVD